eukprot:gene19136-25744_t
MSNITSVVNTRPDWTRSTTGIPIDVVVRVGEPVNGGKMDITAARSRVSLIKPGSTQAKPEDEYEASFVYGQDSKNLDIASRTVVPMVQKLMEGYNTCAGKTYTLEGSPGNDTKKKDSPDGDGIVHEAIDEVFKQLQSKSVTVVAQRRRMPSSKAFDFFLETSYVEIYNETVHDLYQKGAKVAGATYKLAKNDAELRAAFNMGRRERDQEKTDLGSVHERAASIFTIHLTQYAPSAQFGEEDRVLVSKLQFVDMPGAERLAMDPEVLRLREGQLLNKGLLAFQSTLLNLSRDDSSKFSNYEESMLTMLLSDALGGNALTTIIGVLKPGQWDVSSTTMKQLMVAKNAKNYPVVNHGRSRALMQMLRRRLLAMIDDRNTLRDQLHEIPADGDPNAVAISIARVRDMEARLLAEREENSMMVDENDALKEAGTDDLEEKGGLQDALIKSEELRLSLAKTLIDTQMDFNDKETSWVEEKHELEKKMAEYEAGGFESAVKGESLAELVEQRDDLNEKLLAAQAELERRETHIEELQKQLHHDLNYMNDHSAHANAGEHTEDMYDEAGNLIDPDSVDEMREAFRRKLETSLRDVADLSRAVAVMQDDPGTGLKVTPEDMFKTFQKLTDENLKITDARESEMRKDLDEIRERHLELKRKFKSIYLGYRDLRYLVEDKWPHGHDPPKPPTEEELCGATMENVHQRDDEADRHLMTRLREKASQLDSQLSKLKIAQAAGEKGVKLQPTDLAGQARDHNYENDKFVEVAPEKMREFENQKLREELNKLRSGSAGNEKMKRENDALMKQLKILNTDKDRTQLAKEMALQEAELERLRAQKAGAGGHQDVKAQGELESKLHQQEAKTVMAEEQLESLQKYLTQASVQYQREIVRLRSIIGQMDPKMLNSSKSKRPTPSGDSPSSDSEEGESNITQSSLPPSKADSLRKTSDFTTRTTPGTQSSQTVPRKSAGSSAILPPPPVTPAVPNPSAPRQKSRVIKNSSKRREEYLIRWAGYGIEQDTWESAKDIDKKSPQIVTAWLQRSQRDRDYRTGSRTKHKNPSV